MQILTESQLVQMQLLARGPHVEYLGSKDDKPVSEYLVTEPQTLPSDC